MAETRYQLIHAAGNHKFTFPLLQLLPNGDSDWMVDRRSDVCIEGYPRSGNSYAFRAFQRWNPEVRIAHHFHVPMQVKKAVRLRIPTAVLIREPADAVASSAIFHDGAVSIGTLLSSYSSFYETVMDLRDEVAVCEFTAIVHDPRLVPQLINARYGSAFVAGDWTEETDAEVRRMVTSHHQNERTGLELRLPLPSDAKESAKLDIKPRVEEDKRFARAQSAFSQFVGRAK